MEYQRQAGLAWGTGVTGASFTGTVSIAQAVRPQQPQQSKQEAALAGLGPAKLNELHDSGIINDAQFTAAVQAQPDVS